jgi:hypothetical protein
MNFILNLNAFSWKTIQPTQHFVANHENHAQPNFQSAGWLVLFSLGLCKQHFSPIEQLGA